MPTRSRNDPPRNRRPSGEKNVRDPSEHPQGVAVDSDASKQRERVHGDAGKRLPFERDETGDVRERGEPGEPVIEQARRDIEGGQQDTDRRADATSNFNRRSRKPRA
jgi:hypothetical protein